MTTHLCCWSPWRQTICYPDYNPLATLMANHSPPWWQTTCCWPPWRQTTHRPDHNPLTTLMTNNLAPWWQTTHTPMTNHSPPWWQTTHHPDDKQLATLMTQHFYVADHPASRPVEPLKSKCSVDTACHSLPQTDAVNTYNSVGVREWWLHLISFVTVKVLWDGTCRVDDDAHLIMLNNLLEPGGDVCLVTVEDFWGTTISGRTWQVLWLRGSQVDM